MLSACLLRHLACCRKSRGDLSSKSSYLLEPRPSRRTPLSDRRLRPLFHITSRIARDHRLQEIRRGHDWIRSSCAPPALCSHKRSALEGQSEARSPGPIACFCFEVLLNLSIELPAPDGPGLFVHVRVRPFEDGGYLTPISEADLPRRRRATLSSTVPGLSRTEALLVKGRVSSQPF